MKKILLIDDDILQWVIIMGIGNDFYNVSWVPSIYHALKIPRLNEAFDLVICDLQGVSVGKIEDELSKLKTKELWLTSCVFKPDKMPYRFIDKFDLKNEIIEYCALNV